VHPAHGTPPIRGRISACRLMAFIDVAIQARSIVPNTIVSPLREPHERIADPVDGERDANMVIADCVPGHRSILSLRVSIRRADGTFLSRAVLPGTDTTHGCQQWLALLGPSSRCDENDPQARDMAGSPIGSACVASIDGDSALVQEARQSQVANLALGWIPDGAIRHYKRS
jgi:hypothetical protein